MEAPGRWNDLRAETTGVPIPSKSLENWLNPRPAGNSAQRRNQRNVYAVQLGRREAQAFTNPPNPEWSRRSRRCLVNPRRAQVPDGSEEAAVHPIPLGHSSAPALGTLSHALKLDWWSVSHMIIYMFQCSSLKSSHPQLLPQGPKVCSLRLSCCLAHRVVYFINLASQKQNEENSSLLFHCVFMFLLQVTVNLSKYLGLS